MLERHRILLPKGLSAAWSDETITAMAQVAFNLPHMWIHAVGSDWKEKITVHSIKELYKRM
jgi:3-deoxy-alpha-D-manno-octulosonate 8-oxidase